MRHFTAQGGGLRLPPSLVELRQTWSANPPYVLGNERTLEMLTTRGLTATDIDLVCRHREEMFRASNAAGRTEEILRTMTSHFRAWLAPRLVDGSYFGFILEDDGNPVAGIGLMLIDWPPHPSHPSQDKRGYVLNVFVEPDYRKRGLGKFLMDAGGSRADQAWRVVFRSSCDADGRSLI
jgi:GNAT superfamily N-acetyltransferase